MFSANTSQVSNDVKYIEDFFSAWLRTGTGSSQTVTTGIKENTGALVISKSRSAATDWSWYDTFRGATKDLASNTTAAETTQSQGLTAFNTDGHTWGTLAKVNTSGATYVDFVLKPTPKFFDVVTYTGNGTTGRQIPHSLGSVPGCIIVKKTSQAFSWHVYHRGLTNAANKVLLLESTSAEIDTGSAFWGVSDTTFTLASANGGGLNNNSDTYVAYLFAHNAGGFGLTGTDNVISCGSFTTDGSGNATVNLGYEPQLILAKYSSQSSDWMILDSMRGMRVTGNSSPGNNGLFPNLSNAEAVSNATISTYVDPTSTGFIPIGFGPSKTIIYIAIRRGPMKTPTSGTSVFSANTSGNATGGVQTTGFPLDLIIRAARDSASQHTWYDRLRGIQSLTTGSSAVLGSTNTNAEYTSSTGTRNVNNTGFEVSGDWNGPINAWWSFRRAPGFFDEVCYTGTGVARTINHNLGVVPELMIVKDRSSAGQEWAVYQSSIGNTKGLALNLTNAAFVTSTYWNNTTPTSTIFTVGTASATNATGDAFVAYLFASVAGVSKVGSYTGTGATQTISCGFAARFVLIKRTDSTGNWWVWDTARGMVAGTDPRLALNSTAAEVNANWVYTDASGFQIVTTDATVNASGGTYIYLAIA